MKLSLAIASPDDAAAIALLRNETSELLTSLHGKGHWSYKATEQGVRNAMKRNIRILVAKQDDRIVGTMQLVTKKPWAIDTAYFTKVAQPLYLVGMAVTPSMQGKGVGRYMLQELRPFARSWPAQAIRLDAYDSPAGAGGFYHKCGFTERGRVVYRENPLIYFELLL